MPLYMASYSAGSLDPESLTSYNNPALRSSLFLVYSKTERKIAAVTEEVVKKLAADKNYIVSQAEVKDILRLYVDNLKERKGLTGEIAALVEPILQDTRRFAPAKIVGDLSEVAASGGGGAAAGAGRPDPLWGYTEEEKASLRDKERRKNRAVIEAGSSGWSAETPVIPPKITVPVYQINEATEEIEPVQKEIVITDVMKAALEGDKVDIPPTDLAAAMELFAVASYFQSSYLARLALYNILSLKGSSPHIPELVEAQLHLPEFPPPDLGPMKKLYKYLRPASEKAKWSSGSSMSYLYSELAHELGLVELTGFLRRFPDAIPTVFRELLQTGRAADIRSLRETPEIRDYRFSSREEEVGRVEKRHSNFVLAAAKSGNVALLEKLLSGEMGLPWEKEDLWEAGITPRDAATLECIIDKLESMSFAGWAESREQFFRQLLPWMVGPFGIELFKAITSGEGKSWHKLSAEKRAEFVGIARELNARNNDNNAEFNDFLDTLR